MLEITPGGDGSMVDCAFIYATGKFSANSKGKKMLFFIVCAIISDMAKGPIARSCR